MIHSSTQTDIQSYNERQDEPYPLIIMSILETKLPSGKNIFIVKSKYNLKDFGTQTEFNQKNENIVNETIIRLFDDEHE